MYSYSTTVYRLTVRTRYILCYSHTFRPGTYVSVPKVRVWFLGLPARFPLEGSLEAGSRFFCNHQRIDLDILTNTRKRSPYIMLSCGPQEDVIKPNVFNLTWWKHNIHMEGGIFAWNEPTTNLTNRTKINTKLRWKVEIRFHISDIGHLRVS